MEAFMENPNVLIKAYNDLMDKMQVLAFITVGIEMQKKAIEQLKAERTNLGARKKEYVALKRENEANLVLFFEIGVEMIMLELQMLVSIKEDDMNQAWACLVRAQLNCSTLIRVNPYAKDSMQGYASRLESYEHLLFPPMMFCSTGSVVRKSLCSICNEDYGDCDHEKGQVYMGEICARHIHEAELEEVSMVKNPASKLHRVYEFTEGGISKDVLTLRETKPMVDQTEASNS